MNEGKKELVKTIKFFLFSVSAGVIQILAFTLCNEIVQLPYSLSYLIGLVLSVVWNFTLNRKFTFQSSNNVPKAMLLVFLFYLVFTPASTWLEAYLTSRGWNEYVVTVINMVLNMVLEYVYDKYVVFKETDEK